MNTKLSIYCFLSFSMLRAIHHQLLLLGDCKQCLALLSMTGQPECFSDMRHPTIVVIITITNQCEYCHSCYCLHLTILPSPSHNLTNQEPFPKPELRLISLTSCFELIQPDVGQESSLTRLTWSLSSCLLWTRKTLLYCWKNMLFYGNIFGCLMLLCWANTDF